MTTITVNQLKNLIGSINLIDLRSSSSFNNNHIPSSKNIEYNLLINSPNIYLDRKEKYYLYCQRGIKSSKACSYLDKLGYNVVNIAGGHESWILEN